MVTTGQITSCTVRRMGWLSPERYASELEAETARLTAAASRQGPAAPVPTCVRERGFGSTVWSWPPAQQTAGFWLRRMVHDEVVHRFDVEPNGDVAADVAADGIADLLLLFETVAGPDSDDLQGRQLAGTGETLLFSATDTADRWHVSLVPTGITWRNAEADADVTCRAPLAELLLVLNRRRAPGADHVHGDRALLDRWLKLTRL
jgi:hypothetical protein